MHPSDNISVRECGYAVQRVLSITAAEHMHEVMQDMDGIGVDTRKVGVRPIGFSIIHFHSHVVGAYTRWNLIQESDS